MKHSPVPGVLSKNYQPTYFEQHTKGARPSTKDKHTKTRPGKTYNHNQNQKRGKKNQKHEHPIYPNKRK